MTSRTMKLLIIFNLLGLLFFCLAPLSISYEPKQIHPYSLSSDFTLEEQVVVESAIKHFEKEIPCVDFVNVGEHDGVEKTNNIQILDINPVENLEAPVVGLYKHATNTIQLARKSIKAHKKTGKTFAVALPESFRFKVTLHELAHALGMSGKPHPMNANGRTHLSANISYYSSKYLCKEDILYLRKIICNK